MGLLGLYVTGGMLFASVRAWEFGGQESSPSFEVTGRMPVPLCEWLECGALVFGSEGWGHGGGFEDGGADPAFVGVVDGAGDFVPAHFLVFGEGAVEDDWDGVGASVGGAAGDLEDEDAESVCAWDDFVFDDLADGFDGLVLHDAGVFFVGAAVVELHDAEFEVAVLVTGLVFFDEGEGEAGAGGVGVGEGLGGDWGGAGGSCAVAAAHEGAGFLLHVARGELVRSEDGGGGDGA